MSCSRQKHKQKYFNNIRQLYCSSSQFLNPSSQFHRARRIPAQPPRRAAAGGLGLALPHPPSHCRAHPPAHSLCVRSPPPRCQPVALALSEAPLPLLAPVGISEPPPPPCVIAAASNRHHLCFLLLLLLPPSESEVAASLPFGCCCCIFFIQDTKLINETMTKSELHSKKRKRPRNRGPSKNHGLSKCNNNNNNNKDKDNEHEEQEIASDSAKRMKLKEPSKPSTFLEKMRARLSGGHFRMINEKLYTCTGKEALRYFKEEPSLFDVYHAGYKMQMSNWPEKPVDVIIKWLKKQSPSLVIADFGCGDALIAKSVKNKVFSLDLVSNDPEVIACDMSNTPIVSSSVDVAVFCLSLMGTNYESYIEEANRVLKPGGQLMIAEVKSRFDPTTEGADPEKFSKAISELGFNSVKQDFSNKMFILFRFTKKDKQNSKRKQIEWPSLKPCLYKRR